MATAHGIYEEVIMLLLCQQIDFNHPVAIMALLYLDM